MSDNLTIGERIADLRKLRGYSQAALAELTGKSRSAIAQIESNAMRPDWEFIQAIVRLCDTTYEYVFGEVEKPEKSKNEMHIKPPEEGVRYSEEKGGKVMGKVTPSEGAQMHIKPLAKEGLIAQEPERAFYGDLGAAIQKNMAQQAEIMKILLKRMQDLEQRMNSQDAHLPEQ